MLKTDHLAIDSQHKARMLRHRAEEWAPKSSSEGPFSPVCGIQGSGGGGGCHWAVVSRGGFLPILKNITLSTKVRLVKAMVFPVVMYGCESWTIKNKELMLLNCVGEDS